MSISGKRVVFFLHKVLSHISLDKLKLSLKLSCPFLAIKDDIQWTLLTCRGLVPDLPLREGIPQMQGSTPEAYTIRTCLQCASWATNGLQNHLEATSSFQNQTESYLCTTCHCKLSLPSTTQEKPLEALSK